MPSPFEGSAKGPILVPLDGSDMAEQALPHAAAVAAAFGTGLALVQVPEVQYVPVMSAGVWVTREIESHELHENAERYLAEVAEREGLRDLVELRMVPRHPVAAGLLEAIEASGAELVVLTTHGRSGIGRWVFGSTADKLVHAAPTPVYLVRVRPSPEPVVDFRCIMVPLDGSELSESAIPTAHALARATGGHLHLMRVPTVPGYATAVAETAGWIPDLLRQTALEAETYLTNKARELDHGDVEVRFDTEIVVAGGVAEAILGHAKRVEADVIVMTSHGRSGVGRWVFGSVADRVTRASETPVWLVRAAVAAEVA